MATTKVLPGFIRLPGRSEQFKEIATGKIISRRQYDKLRRPGFTNESLAKLNRDTHAEHQLALPARGRTSVRKLAAPIRADIVAARAEEKTRKEREKELKAEQAKITKKVEAAKRKRVKVKKVTSALLQPGAQGRRIPFNDWDDYSTMYDDAKKNKNIFAYGLGLEGVDVRDGRTKTMTIFHMRAFDKKISEDDFDDAMSEALEDKPYLVLSNYYIHLAFDIEYARAKKEKGTTKRVFPKRKKK